MQTTTQLVGNRLFDFTVLFSFDEFVGLDTVGPSGPINPGSYRLMAGLSVHQLVK